MKFSRLRPGFLVLIVTLMFAFLPVIALAESENTSQICISKDNYNNVQVADFSGNLLESSETITVYASVKDAAGALREEMTYREKEIAFALQFADGNYLGTESEAKTLSEMIYKEALAHTGVGDEGDYLRFHLHDWTVTYSVTQDGDMPPVFVFVYLVNYYTDFSQEKAVTSEVNAALAELKLDGKSDFEKIRDIFEYITRNVRYDYENLDEENYLLMYSAYAAIVNRTAVCQGYASLLYRMMLESGIDCRMITGNSREERHAWNIVELEDRYYYLDATWDEGVRPSAFSYFLKGEHDFPAHSPDQEYLKNAFVKQYPIADTSYGPANDTTKRQTDGFSYTIENGFAVIEAYSGEQIHVTVPPTLDGYPVLEIGHQAFSFNNTIQSVFISEGIRYIYSGGDTSFVYCNALTLLSLPSSLVVDTPELSDSVFGGGGGIVSECIELEEVLLPNGNPYLTVVDGVVYNANMTTLLLYPSNKSGDRFEVPESVTMIADAAFEEQRYLEEVVLPDSIKYIGYWAFNGAGYLNTINIPEECSFIGQFAFQETGITSVHIPANLRYVEGITEYAFQGKKLKEITVDSRNKNYKLIDGALYAYSAERGGWGLCLYPCDNGAETYVMPEEATWMSHALTGSKTIREVILNDKITEIPYQAFYGCYWLERLVIPQNVTYIGKDAFTNCFHLTGIFYDGTQEQWGQVSIAEGANLPKNIHFEVSNIEDHVTAVNVVPPKCVGDGFTLCSCACGYFYKKDFTSSESCHIWGEWEEPFPNSVDPLRMYRRECMNCGYRDHKYVAEHTHEYISNIILPTCTDYGYATHACMCGDKYIDNYTASKGHTWDEGVVEASSLYAEGSVKRYTCTTCGAVMEETYPEQMHIHFYNKVVCEATCTRPGMYYEICACGDKGHISLTHPNGHEWNEGRVTVDPTAEYEGEQILTCLVCGEKRIELLPVHEHSYEAVVTPPSCGAVGYTTYTCACGESWEDDIVEPTGEHTLSFPGYADPTCTEAGGTGFPYCEVCDTWFDGGEEIPALGHSWDDGVVTVEPTEDTEGVKTFTCATCGDIRTEAIPKLEHTHYYTDSVTAPACMEGGYTTHTCKCGDSYVDTYVDAQGHSWDEGIVTREPTEESEGVKMFVCTRCGETENEAVPKLEHTHRYFDTLTAPTCEEQGYTTHTCRCGDSYMDTYVEALGHSWDEGVVTLEPTEETEGVKTYTCTACGETKTESIPKLEHTHAYTQTVTAPTCTEQGCTTYTCTCGDSYVDSYVDALGHSWDEGVVTLEPTEESEGVKTYICTVCGESKTESVPKLEHTHAYTDTVTAPTCTEQGYTTHTCNCGESYVDTYVEATGHSFGYWLVEQEPVDGVGKKYRECACGEKEHVQFEMPLTDIPNGKYYSKPVFWAYENGITKGKTATEFQKDAECTRKQIVMFLWRAAGQPEPESMDCTFDDVKNDSFRKAILWAVEKGITNGTSATKFSPDAPCTRKQIVMFLWRYFGKPALTEEQQNHEFTDMPGGQFRTAILWAFHNGITTGKTDTTFAPDATCTRGQIVTFLYRAMVES